MTEYALVKIKTAGGEETPRFEAWITCDGATVAQVWNDGCGGSCGYRWANRNGESEAALKAFAESWWESSGEKAKQIAFFAANGMPDHDGKNAEVIDSWVMFELERIQDARRYKRQAKTKTLFRLNDDAANAYRTLTGGAVSAASVQWLAKKFGPKLGEVYDPQAEKFTSPSVWLPELAKPA